MKPWRWYWYHFWANFYAGAAESMIKHAEKSKDKFQETYCWRMAQANIALGIKYKEKRDALLRQGRSPY